MVKAFPFLKIIMTSTGLGAAGSIIKVFGMTRTWTRSGCATIEPNLLGIVVDKKIISFRDPFVFNFYPSLFLSLLY